MTNSTRNLNTPMSRLPRAAERATHAWEAHRDKDPTLDAQGATMVAAAEEFRAAQTGYHDRQTQATVKRQARIAALEHLQRAKRRALAAVGRELLDFDTTGFTDSDVPEDAIARGRELQERIDGRTREGAALPFAEHVVGPLAAALEAAETAARAAYEAETEAQKALDDQRDAAHKLDDKLIAFRAILRSVIGTKHRDYRMLRTPAARTPTEDPTTIDGPDITDNPENDNALPNAEAPTDTATGTG